MEKLLMSDDYMVTLHAGTEGVPAFPMFCGHKMPTLDWAQRLEAAHIILPGAEWTPCCRDPNTNIACALDMFTDPDDDTVRQCILHAANNTPTHDTTPPQGLVQ